jgi:MFS family permease
MLNAFSVTFAAMPLAAGSLADRYGRRGVLIAGIALLGAAIALVVVFALIEIRLAERAMLDVRLFRRPEFVAVVCQPFTVTLGFVILLIYLPAYLQGVGARSTLAFGVMDNAAVSTVPARNAGAAAGIFNTMRSAGESIAVAGAAAWLTTLTGIHLRNGGLDAHTATQLAGQAVQGHPSANHHATLAAGFTSAFHALGLGLAALSTLGAVLTYLALAPNRPGSDRRLSSG